MQPPRGGPGFHRRAPFPPLTRIFHRQRIIGSRADRNPAAVERRFTTKDIIGSRADRNPAAVMTANPKRPWVSTHGCEWWSLW